MWCITGKRNGEVQLISKTHVIIFSPFFSFHVNIIHMLRTLDKFTLSEELWNHYRFEYSTPSRTAFEKHCAGWRAERPNFHDRREMKMEVLYVVHSKNRAEFYACFSGEVRKRKDSHDSVDNIINILDLSGTNSAASMSYQYDNLSRLTRASSADALTDWFQTYAHNTHLSFDTMKRKI